MTRATARRTGTKGVARAEREAQIVDVAGRVFAERGYAGTSVADIAHDAGISKPLIYNYFGSKEGLFTACVEHAGELVAGDIERTSGLGEVGLGRALATLDGLYGVLAGTPWAWPVLTDATAPPAARDTLTEFADRTAARAVEGVRELMALAGDTDPLDLDALTSVWVQVVDALVRWWLAHPDVSPAAMTERSARLFAAVFGADVASPAAAPARG